MKIKAIGIFTSFIILFCLACEKDKICLEHIPCSSSEYLPLNIGNYWVYELQNYNLTTYAISTSPRYDTIKVTGDTIIRNYRFHTVESTSGLLFNYLEYVSYLRDSSGYLVNEKGEILFSDSDFDRPLNRADAIIINGEEQYIEYAIQDTTFVKITPAGVFACLDYRGQAWINSEWNEIKYTTTV